MLALTVSGPFVFLLGVLSLTGTLWSLGTAYSIVVPPRNDDGDCFYPLGYRVRFFLVSAAVTALLVVLFLSTLQPYL